MAVAQELLEILRCPYCVSGPARKPGQDPGRLELVKNGTWLVCREPDCGRKYPIKEDIPVMLIEEGDRWIATAVEDLPEPGPLVEPSLIPQSGSAALPPADTGDRQLFGLALGLLGGVLLVAFFIWLGRRGRPEFNN